MRIGILLELAVIVSKLWKLIKGAEGWETSSGKEQSMTVGVRDCKEAYVEQIIKDMKGNGFEEYATEENQKKLFKLSLENIHLFDQMIGAESDIYQLIRILRFQFGHVKKEITCTVADGQGSTTEEIKVIAKNSETKVVYRAESGQDYIRGDIELIAKHALWDLLSNIDQHVTYSAILKSYGFEGATEKLADGFLGRADWQHVETLAGEFLREPEIFFPILERGEESL